MKRSRWQIHNSKIEDTMKLLRTIEIVRIREIGIKNIVGLVEYTQQGFAIHRHHTSCAHHIMCSKKMHELYSSSPWGMVMVLAPNVLRPKACWTSSKSWSFFNSSIYAFLVSSNF